jgi:16S rRNA (cytosine967-C5)-methyltransferase
MDAHAVLPPLWRLLRPAAGMIQGVRGGRSLTSLLETVAPDLRAGVQALSFHALRWLGLAEAVRDRVAQRRPPPAADALLCTSLALMALDDALYPAFTLVDQTVEAAKRHASLRPYASFLNACLRRFLREREELLGSLLNQTVARWNHPVWWVERLQRDHPEHWRSVLDAAQNPAPMVLRVNTRRISVPAFCDRLASAGIHARAIGETAVQLDRSRPVRDIPGHDAGWVSVQSAAAQRAAPLLLSGLDVAAPRVLDACAAPGGKTAHVLEQCPEARVTAIEVDAGRSKRIVDNLSRLGLEADVCVANAAYVESWWDGEPFDAILLDAPCSASGIVRRHPDVRWLRRESDIVQLAVQQDRLLAALWPLVVPGGRLLFCTCSVFRQEGAERVEAFLARNTDAVPLPAPGHLLPLTNGESHSVGDNGNRDEDGFFYALLQKHPR